MILLDMRRRGVYTHDNNGGMLKIETTAHFTQPLLRRIGFLPQRDQSLVCIQLVLVFTRTSRIPTKTDTNRSTLLS